MTTALDHEPLVLRLAKERSLLSSEQLAALGPARERFPGSVEEALVGAAILDERVVARIHAEHLGVPWLEVVESPPVDDGETVLHLVENARGAEPTARGRVDGVVAAVGAVAAEIGEVACRRGMVAPIRVAHEHLELACVDPSSFATLEQVRVRTGRLVRAYAATLGAVGALLDGCFGKRDLVREIATEDGPVDEETAGGIDRSIVDLQRPIPRNKESQVLRIVNTLLAQAIDEGVSDIHVEPYEDSVRVRFRIDGKMLETTPPPRALFVPTVSRLKILAKMDIAERRIPQDGAIAIRHDGRRVDMRVSTVPTVYGEKMVIRLLKKESIPERMTDLGFSERQANDFVAAARAPHGLMFVTGPTGSGKSTTLYCCLNLINDPAENIVTVEDPVEFKFHGLNQVHVKSKVGLTFANALRAFLRQDPDKIMVGEVRDQETAQICMRAALTGHLVLSTLHTNTALEAVNRLIDMGVEPFLLGPALRLVEAQRLARKLCLACREPVEVPDEVAERFGLPVGRTLYRAAEGGCEECREVGYRGRIGLYEVVPIGATLGTLIADGAGQTELKRVAASEGVLFLEDDARQKVLAGITSLEEVGGYIQGAE